MQGSLAGDTEGRYFLLIVLEGEGLIRHSRGETKLARGMQLFVPASVGTHEFRSGAGMAIFKSMPAAVPAAVS